MTHPDIFPVEFFVEAVRDHHRRMWCIEWDITKERACLIFFDKRHRMFGKVIHNESLTAYSLSVVIQRWAKVMTPVARRESVVFAKASLVGVIGGLCAVVPLAKCTCCIAGCLEQVCDRCFVRIQAALAAADAADPSAGIVPSRQELGTSRCAYLADIEMFQRRTSAGQRVNVWSRKVRVAVDTEIAPTLIVGEDNDDIG